LDKFQIAETETFSKKINSDKFSHLYYKISNDVFPVLRKNPFFGINIKKLKGKFNDLYRFRMGDFRIFYKIDEIEKLVFIINIENKKDAYR